MRIRITSEGGEPDEAGAYIRINHGFEALEIDGHCSYWMNSGWQFNLPLFRDRGWRTGTLDATTASALERALPLGDLKSLADCGGTTTIGASSRVVRTSGSRAACDGTGPRFEAAWAVVTAAADQLWSRSSPVMGAIRISVFSVGPIPGSHQPYAWPLGTLTPFLQTRGSGPEDAHTLVTDLEAAGKLRTLRESYLSDRLASEGAFGSWDGMTVSDGVTTATTFMRDALPYEDQAGHPPF